MQHVCTGTRCPRCLGAIHNQGPIELRPGVQFYAAPRGVRDAQVPSPPPRLPQ
jgi:hypothetical protein